MYLYVMVLMIFDVEFDNVYILWYYYKNMCHEIWYENVSQDIYTFLWVI